MARLTDGSVVAAVLLCAMGVFVPTAAAAAEPSATADDRGFVNLSARCDAPSNALAIVRTEGSLVVICAEPNGTYQYRGIRFADGAALNAAAVNAVGGGFVAINEGVSYTLSSKELLIAASGNVIRREAVVEYRAPGSYPAEVGGSAPTPSSKPRPSP
jgi:hypothetical protein